LEKSRLNLLITKEGGSKMNFYGYPRPDGKAGARNYVALIPTTGCVNAVCYQIEKMIRGTKALLHHQGCLHPSKDTEQVTKTLINLGKNPNVAAVLLVGLGCEMVVSEEVLSGIRKSGKPVDLLRVHEVGGMLDTVNKGAKTAADMVLQASTIRREKFGLGIEKSLNILIRVGEALRKETKGKNGSRIQPEREWERRSAYSE
jgi:altronate dehydratase